jgi:acyl carrier protein
VSTEQDKARTVISELLERAGKSQAPLTDDLGLYGDGLELDSLESAELSAMLEDELGSDPFSAGGTMPETVGDILKFYEVTASA